MHLLIQSTHITFFLKPSVLPKCWQGEVWEWKCDSGLLSPLTRTTTWGSSCLWPPRVHTFHAHGRLEYGFLFPQIFSLLVVHQQITYSEKLVCRQNGMLFGSEEKYNHEISRKMDEIRLCIIQRGQRISEPLPPKKLHVLLYIKNLSHNIFAYL